MLGEGGQNSAFYKPGENGHVFLLKKQNEETINYAFSRKQDETDLFHMTVIMVTIVPS